MQDDAKRRGAGRRFPPPFACLCIPFGISSKNCRGRIAGRGSRNSYDSQNANWNTVKAV